MGEQAIQNIMRMIDSEIRQKRKPEEAISRLCQINKIGNVSNETASRWLERYKRGDRTLGSDAQINAGQLAMLKLVATQYADRYVIYEQRCPIYKLVYLSDRYFIVYDCPEWKLGTLYVYDFFHGQTQRLCVTDAPHVKFLNDSSFQAHSINSYDLLIAEHGTEIMPKEQQNEYVTYLYLLRIKYSEWNGQMSSWTATILDSKRLSRFYLEEKILINPHDRSKFTMFASDEFFDAIKGQIKNGKIELSEKISFDKRLRCKRLLNENHVQGLENVLISSADTYEERAMLQLLHGVLGFQFGELKLDEGKLNTVEQKIACSFVSPTCANWFHVPIYKWSNERLYIDLMFLRDSFSIYSFDPKTGQSNPTRLAALGREGVEGSIIDMHIDENEIITVAVNGNSTSTDKWPLYIYRYPTKKPDMLQNIVWQKVRKPAMNMSGWDYLKVIQQIPKSSPLLPFSKKLR